MIELKNVTYRYPFSDRNALEDISVKVRPGEAVLCTGVSGCGKSTLIRLITCTDLSDFERTLHGLQALDVYYAKPRLLQKNDTKEIGAFYALTEECESVFPVRADGFLNLSELKVTEGFVQFVLYSEQRVLEGMFPYEQFVEELRGYDVRQFDGDHILIPPMTKAELEDLAGKLRGKGRVV